mmetsp:Transcript_27249/g.78989  ORF Transcript_27249/g.78989 Transcript_27249/m.78989 type:complete len:207 (-) Transcript_27249:4215-4835(-)
MHVCRPGDEHEHHRAEQRVREQTRDDTGRNELIGSHEIIRKAEDGGIDGENAGDQNSEAQQSLWACEDVLEENGPEEHMITLENSPERHRQESVLVVGMVVRDGIGDRLRRIYAITVEPVAVLPVFVVAQVLPLQLVLDIPEQRQYQAYEQEQTQYGNLSEIRAGVDDGVQIIALSGAQIELCRFPRIKEQTDVGQMGGQTAISVV